MTGYDLREVLNGIDPGALNYEEWLQCGMALEAEGYPMEEWESWSRRDPARFHRGECAKKWAGFNGSGIKGGTLVQIAREHGWVPDNTTGHELDWNDTIGGSDERIVDLAWMEEREVIAPTDADWHPAHELKRYLEILFEAGENVGYVTQSYRNEEKGRFLPTKGNWDRTAGELIEALDKCGDDIGQVLGDYNPEAGAWIRFNPLDGQGCKNENVTEFRFALVESDSMSIEKQNALIHELELPVAVLVHSGGKSLHAIVRIDAANYGEYRQRVDFLYDICKKNGLQIDAQNRNPSRLSRMPGAMRNGQRQYIVAEGIGKASFTEWKEWVEASNDDLPEPENLADVWDKLPPLSPPLIHGVLRQGHKLLLAGPSKAGKSFALIELCCAIAEGKEWLGWRCAQGRVFYVNLELDPASSKHRFADVYKALGWRPNHIDQIDTWDLRGRAVPMDKLAPKLIRRCKRKQYIAVVIDPIYKVLTGDENSADQMALFCNQFDRIAAELNCAVIYCHHHSKGLQGAKRSMDRASGSGVFARDPDAMLDMIELAVPDTLRTQQENRAGCKTCAEWLDRSARNWREDIGQDDLLSLPRLLEFCKERFSPPLYAALTEAVEAVKEQTGKRTAWRVEGTLREFERFPPKDLWFEYPVHRVDADGLLADIGAEGEKGSTWTKNFKRSGKLKKSPNERKQERADALDTAFDACSINGTVTLDDLAEYMGVTAKTVKNHLKECGDYDILNSGDVKRRNAETEK